MRLSVMMIAAGLLASVASPVLAASQRDQDGCGTNALDRTITGCLRIDHVGGEIAQKNEEPRTEN